jgi:hypothetical protein
MFSFNHVPKAFLFVLLVHGHSARHALCLLFGAVFSHETNLKNIGSPESMIKDTPTFMVVNQVRVGLIMQDFVLLRTVECLGLLAWALLG